VVQRGHSRTRSKDIDVDCKSSIVQTIAAESIRQWHEQERTSRKKGEWGIQGAKEREEEILDLSTESVKGSSLSLESVDYVEGCDSLALGVFSVSD
jgi:hypothetical protein